MTTAARTRRVTKVPGYLLHKKSGQARVRLNEVDHYLGPHGSEESRQKYNRLIAEYLAGAVFDQNGVATVNSGLTIAEIAAAFLKHARKYYVKNGQETDEVDCLKSAVRPLLELYPDLPANDFGPIALKAVRQKMVGPQTRTIRKKTVTVQWTRRYINMSVSRIRRMFKWAVENELVDDRVLVRLQAVAPLTQGRTDAKEHSPRHSLTQEAIDKVKAKVSARTGDLIELWLLTGARPGELIKLTGEMIDRATYQKKGVWVAELSDHKMVHKNKRRVLVFGPKAQLILTRYMSADPSKRLFPINRATASDAMKKACRDLNIPIFTAHWLRHTAATRVREDCRLSGTSRAIYRQEGKVWPAVWGAGATSGMVHHAGSIHGGENAIRDRQPSHRPDLDSRSETPRRRALLPSRGNRWGNWTDRSDPVVPKGTRIDAAADCELGRPGKCSRRIAYSNSPAGDYSGRRLWVCWRKP